jgi:AcrR family transcriptional regulator
MGSIEKRDQIMAAGGRVFPRLGYHGTTVEDVIQEAGVARATFYHYYSDKRELFAAVAGAIIDQIVERLASNIDEITSDAGEAKPEVLTPAGFLDLLNDLMHGLFGLLRQNRGMANLFLHEMVVVDKDMLKLYYDFQSRLCDQFERLVSYGIEIGVLADNDRRRAAEFIVSGQLHVAGSFSNRTGHYPVEEVSRKFMEFQLNGLVSKQGGREREVLKAHR